MSRAARDWAWRCRGLTPAERVVLLALAELADDDGGQCFPSLGQLERVTELSRRGVTKALAGLDGRLIERDRGGPRRSTSCRLLLAGSGEGSCESKELRSQPEGRGQSASRNAVPQGLVLADAEQGRAQRFREGAASDSGQPNGEGRERHTPGNKVPHGGEPCSPPFQGEPGSLGNSVPAAREQGARCREQCATLVGNRVPPNRHRNRHLTASEPSLSEDAGTQPPPRESRGAGRAIPIPRDWRPSERVFDWAAKQAMPRPWVKAQLDEFLVYWSDTGECRKSWDAIFINRLRSVQAQQPAGTSDAPRQRLSAKDYRQGATPLAAIPWLKPTADG
jgi:hypothetical protein